METVIPTLPTVIPTKVGIQNPQRRHSRPPIIIPAKVGIQNPHPNPIAPQIRRRIY